jgi:hypothetical protein
MIRRVGALTHSLTKEKSIINGGEINNSNMNQLDHVTLQIIT